MHPYFFGARGGGRVDGGRGGSYGWSGGGWDGDGRGGGGGGRGGNGGNGSGWGGGGEYLQQDPSHNQGVPPSGPFHTPDPPNQLDTDFVFAMRLQQQEQQLGR